MNPGCDQCRRHHLLQDGHDIRTVQKMLGHRSVKSTMIDTHVLNHGYGAAKSPLNRLALEAPPN